MRRIVCRYSRTRPRSSPHPKGPLRRIGNPLERQYATPRDTGILRTGRRSIAVGLVLGLQRDVAVITIFVQCVGEALAALLVYWAGNLDTEARSCKIFASRSSKRILLRCLADRLRAGRQRVRDDRKYRSVKVAKKDHCRRRQLAFAGGGGDTL